MQISLVRDTISEASAKVGRTPSEITVVAASKTVSADILRELSDCGIFICGENRVQELLEKYGKVETLWHMIGRLQTNKVKYLMGKVEMIQSLDRIDLAAEIQKQAKKAGIVMPVLAEVNIGKEESKGGVFPEALPEFLQKISDMENIRVCGLMAIPPMGIAREKSRLYFMQMRELFERSRATADWTVLSMGMSEDYDIAIECGSTMVRLGRALFGARK